MATQPRRTTGKAAPSKGAASAVSPTDPDLTATADEKVAVELENTPVTVDAANPPSDAERELLRAAAATDKAAEREAAQLGVPADEGIAAAAKLPPNTLPGGTLAPPASALPGVTQGVKGQVGTQAQAPAADAPDPARELAVLQRLADTSGREAVTPYPSDEVAAPDPLNLLPPINKVQNWTRDTDTPLTGRVLSDGWRVQVNGNYQFARRGDQVTAPIDIMRGAEARGVVYITEE